MITFRGFFSMDNLRLLREAEYIIAASFMRKEVKAVYSSASKTVDRADNVIMYEGYPIFCKNISFSMDDLELHGYFYHDVRRESDERADLHRNIMERRKRIESLQVRRGIKKSIESIAGSYMRYITYRIENNLVVTSARDNAVSAAENRMGRFLLAYRHRDAIDKVFHVLKTDIDIFPRRCVLSVFRNACLSYLYTWCLYPLLPGRNWTYPYKRPQSQTHP